RASIGCSMKGKVWSQGRTNDPAVWMDWCHGLGSKILNEALEIGGILRNLVRPRRQDRIPEDKVPLAIDWPEEFLQNTEDKELLSAGAQTAPAYDCEIAIDDFDTVGGI